MSDLNKKLSALYDATGPNSDKLSPLYGDWLAHSCVFYRAATKEGYTRAQLRQYFGPDMWGAFVEAVPHV